MQIEILGYKWRVHLLSRKAFKKKFGKCQAITDMDTQEIWLNEKFFHRRIVAHEVSHSFFHYTCTEELRLSMSELEEVLADFVAVHGQAIHKTTDIIMKKLK